MSLDSKNSFMSVSETGVSSLERHSQTREAYTEADVLPIILTDIFPYNWQDQINASLQEINELNMNNPELAQAILEQQVVGAHGSASGSIIGVFKHGLRPQNTLDTYKELIASGTHDHGAVTINKTHVSFIQWFYRHTLNKDYARDIALPQTEESLQIRINNFNQLIETLNPGSVGHTFAANRLKRDQATLNFLQKPNKTEMEETHAQLIQDNFPIIYFISGAAVNRDNTEVGFSDVAGEFAVEGGVLKPNIPMLLIPTDKFSLIKDLGDRYGYNPLIFSIESFRT